jgi:hypothetical protein
MFIGRFAHPIRAFISLLCSALERPRLLWNIRNISFALALWLLRGCVMAWPLTMTRSLKMRIVSLVFIAWLRTHGCTTWTASGMYVSIA